MSMRRYELRVCGHGLTTSKLFIHIVPFYGLRNCSSSPKFFLKKTTTTFGKWKINVYKMKDLFWKSVTQYEWRWIFLVAWSFSSFARGEKEAMSWGSIGTFRFVRSQSTAEIFLASDHMGDVHSASVTRGLACWSHEYDLLYWGRSWEEGFP